VVRLMRRQHLYLQLAQVLLLTCLLLMTAPLLRSCPARVDHLCAGLTTAAPLPEQHHVVEFHELMFE
jgi:hypothetical protein